MRKLCEENEPEELANNTKTMFQAEAKKHLKNKIKKLQPLKTEE